MRLKRSRSRWMWLLALGALSMSAFFSVAARADDAEGLPLPGHMQAVKIGPHAVLIVDEVGNAMMYQDPTSTETTCEDLQACWGFSADGGVAIFISDGGGVVLGVDAASGTVFEDTTPSP